MRFSIIVVCLNAGDELKKTVQSILNQKYTDYEIIIKDGGSSDGSIEAITADERLHIIVSKDHGIYDAMNQALEAATGDFIYFLNCGDYLKDSDVLENVSKKYEEIKLTEDGTQKSGFHIIYGNIYERISEAKVSSNPAMDEFACYKNVPCHQACFYERELVKMHPFDISYKVRADYEQFLWCYYIGKAKLTYIDVMIASYMGGGYSETKENLKRSANEHLEIVRKYMSEKNIRRYKWRMILSLAPLRSKIAKNPYTSGIYNGLKSKIYNKKQTTN